MRTPFGESHQLPMAQGFDYAGHLIKVSQPDDGIPVANTESHPDPIVGTSSALSASATDPDGADAAIEYLWEIAAKPDGSSPTIGNAESSQATLNVDQAGSYQLRLTVTDTDSNTTSQTMDVEVLASATSIEVVVE